MQSAVILKPLRIALVYNYFTATNTWAEKKKTNQMQIWPTHTNL